MSIIYNSRLKKGEIKMKLDLIEHRPNEYTKKMVIISSIVLLSVALFSILGIKVAESYHKKKVSEYKERQITMVQQQNQSKQEEKLVANENISSNITNQMTTNQSITNIKLPVYSETAKRKMKNLYTDTSGPKTAYLTFDDGPSQAVTPQILDLLKKENIKATFFVMGKNVKANPELVRREYREGHYIANHSYTHEYDNIYKSVDNVFKEFNQTEDVIRKAIGVKEYQSHLFRFPGGSTGGKYAKLKAKARTELNKKNISYLDWNALTSDAAGANTKKKIIQNLKATVKGKHTVVILMHDAAGKILTAETLPEVIKYLREQGYVFDNFYSIMK